MRHVCAVISGISCSSNKGCWFGIRRRPNVSQRWVGYLVVIESAIVIIKIIRCGRGNRRVFACFILVMML